MLGVAPPYSATIRKTADPANVSTSTATPGQVEYDPERNLLWVKSTASMIQDAPSSAQPNNMGLRQREAEGWVGVSEVQIEGAHSWLISGIRPHIRNVIDFKGRRAMSALAFRNGYIAPARTLSKPPFFTVNASVTAS